MSDPFQIATETMPTISNASEVLFDATQLRHRIIAVGMCGLLAGIILMVMPMSLRGDETNQIDETTLSGDTSSPHPLGRLLLFGGAERDSNHLLWDAFVEAAGGKGAKIAIFPTASSFPERTGALYQAHMKNLGLDPFVVPAAPMMKNVEVAKVIADPFWIDKVGQADAIFLAGGEQSRYRKTLIQDDGEETPLLKVIRKVYERGGLIAGTSAGTAIMSRIMFIDAEQIVPVLVHGVKLGKEIDHGLGFLAKDWFIDQHFLTRGRFGRSLVAMQSMQFPYGIGIDDDTAIMIEQGRLARVIGYRGALVMDAKSAVREAKEKRFQWKNLKLSYLSHGDSIDLQSMKVTPSKEKRDEDRVDPFAKDFKPYYLLKQFYNDIFANTQLLDLMYKLVDSPHDEAIGLAFDGEAARVGETPGFEFRFYRKPDTVSWDSPIAIGDSATVLNVYLDIRPIEIQGPLYVP